MAQVVIFAPPGEDVSTGETALKEAGHEVEVVEATAENLLHMAIGMLGDEGKTEEPAEEEPPAEEPPADDEAPAEEPAEENPAKMEALGTCSVDGDKVPAKKGKRTRLFVSELSQGEKLTFTLGESSLSIWEPKMRFFLSTSAGRSTGAAAPVLKSRYGQTYLEVGPELHRFF